MKYFHRIVFFILSAGVFLFIGCEKNLNKATILQYSAEELGKLYQRAETGEGEDEFSRREDRKVVINEIEKIEKGLYFTYRTGMRWEDWEEISDSLPTWYYTDEKIPLWKDKLIPSNELVLPTHTPWLIGSYSFDKNMFLIYTPQLEYLVKDDRERLAFIIFAPWNRCFGGVTPTTYKDASGSIKSLSAYWRYNDGTDALVIKADEKKAKRLIDKLRGIKETKLKVYYKIKGGMCYIVKVEGFDKNDELLFKTKLDLDTDIK